MPDARTIIDGTVASDPRYNTGPNGEPVANLRVLAGRSKKDEQGNWQNLSTTAFDIAFWREHAQLVDAFQPAKGDKVIVSGTIAGVESYQGQNGESLSVKVSGDGLRVFPKRDQQAGGFQQAGSYQQAPPQGQPSYSPVQQAGGWRQPPQQGDPWSAPQDQAPPF